MIDGAVVTDDGDYDDVLPADAAAAAAAAAAAREKATRREQMKKHTSASLSTFLSRFFVTLLKFFYEL